MKPNTASLPPMELAFGIGDWVRPVMPPGYDEGDIGMVVAHEIYTDHAGARVQYHVRFRQSDGTIKAETVGFRADELEGAA